MDETDRAAQWVRRIEDMIARAAATSPTEPGLYRMPCGECYVDFFVASDGTEVWLVPGDPTSHTRESIAARGHGDHAWERMYTLGDAVAELHRVADRPAHGPRTFTAATADTRHDDVDEEPLSNVARRFGIDLDG